MDNTEKIVKAIDHLKKAQALHDRMDKSHEFMTKLSGYFDPAKISAAGGISQKEHAALIVSMSEMRNMADDFIQMGSLFRRFVDLIEPILTEKDLL